MAFETFSPLTKAKQEDASRVLRARKKLPVSPDVKAALRDAGISDDVKRALAEARTSSDVRDAVADIKNLGESPKTGEPARKEEPVVVSDELAELVKRDKKEVKQAGQSAMPKVSLEDKWFEEGEKSFPEDLEKMAKVRSSLEATITDMSSFKERVVRLEAEIAHIESLFKDKQAEAKGLKFWQVLKKMEVKKEISKLENELIALKDNLKAIKEAGDKPVSPSIMGRGRTIAEKPVEEEVWGDSADLVEEPIAKPPPLPTAAGWIEPKQRSKELPHVPRRGEETIFAEGDDESDGGRKQKKAAA